MIDPQSGLNAIILRAYAELLPIFQYQLEAMAALSSMLLSVTAVMALQEMAVGHDVEITQLDFN
ncbi:hypothetical protein B0D95_10765 [Cellvibrio sp. PSBB023]|nr:hypothetical protein B0D95_10765 [Cellvibrio sp. PSBB023]